ncbi:MAG: hypothetical protein KIS92_23650 [Planctomycetota bacterium]|nr:hypothetical protein [Planctomycetota bacterium]
MMKNPEPPAADAVDLIRPYLEGELGLEEARRVEARIADDPEFARQVQTRRTLLEALGRAYGARALSPGFEQTAQKRLAHPTTGPVLVVPGQADEPVPEPAQPWAERLGAAPWWMISGAFHALLLLLLTLIGMAVLRNADREVVIVTNLEKRPEVQPEEKKTERDVFKNTAPIETTEVTEQPAVVTHEDVEIADHAETANDADASEARGEDGLADVLLGGSGTSASLGIGGGGGGAYGRPTGAGGRMRRAAAGGGGKATESAVDKALEWLARHQEPDGHWDLKKHHGSANGDTAVTGLAVLAFLGAGHSEKVGKYKENVQRGVKWLIAQQQADGKIEKAGDRPSGYNHSIAGLALAEAAGMGRVKATQEAAQKAVAYSTDVFQQGKGSEKLGWRYNPQELGDISVSGWFIMQIKSAKIAGLKVDTVAFEGADKFLDTVMTEGPKANDPYSGHKYGYIHDGNGPNGIRVKNPHGNTAVGILGRQFLGYKREELQGGVEFFIKDGGVPAAAHPEFYYWYYGTLCAFQQGGDIWKNWNEGLKAALLPTQRKGGDEDGSWDPKGFSTEGAESQGGRVFTTAMGALCLEVYYRYLPLYR